MTPNSSFSARQQPLPVLLPNITINDDIVGSVDSKTSNKSNSKKIADLRRASRISLASSLGYDLLPPEQSFGQAVSESLRRPSLLRSSFRRGSTATTTARKSSTTPNVPSVIILEEKDDKTRKISILPRQTITDSADTIATTVVEEEEEVDLLTNRKRIFILCLLCTTHFAVAVCYSLIAPFFPIEMVRKGGTATLAGIVMGSYDVTRTIINPIVGKNVNLIGINFMIVSGPFLAATCTILFGLLDKGPGGAVFTILGCALRIVAGVGCAFYFVVTITARPILFAKYISFAFSVMQASYTTGIIVGPAAGGGLYALGGYGLPFYVIGCVALVFVVMLKMLIPDLSLLDAVSQQNRLRKEKLALQLSISNGESVPTTDKNPPKSLTVVAALTTPSILYPLVLTMTQGLMLAFYATNLALHIEPLLGSNAASRTGYIILIAGVTEVIMAPFSGFVQDRNVPERAVVIVGMSLNFIGLSLIGPSPVLFFLTKSLWLVIVGSAIFGSGVGCTTSAPFKIASKATLAKGYPESQETFGLLAGLYSSAYTLGTFGGAFLGGLLHDLVGYPWASTIICAYALLIIISVVVTDVYERCRKQ